MVSSIANSLGFGSGLDVQKLVTDLAAASRGPKIARIDAREKAVRASISAVALARSDLEGFATSLSALVAGGTLQSQPASSNPSVLTVAANGSGRAVDLAARVEVQSLARAQLTASGYHADAGSAIGEGTLALTVGALVTNVVIDAAGNSLTGIASAINASGAGIMASVASDAQGSRLVLKGADGAANGFSVSSSDADLAALAGELTTHQTASDAVFTVDGLPFRSLGNIVSDAVPGVTLTLQSVGNAQLSTTSAHDVLRSTLDDFVSVFNELSGHLQAAREATNGNVGLRSLERALGALIAQPVSSGTPASLSAIGVKTNRDGTIALDPAQFERAFAADARAVERLFVPLRDATRDATTDPGIGGAIAALKTAATGTGGTLASASSVLTRQAELLTKQRTAVEAREDVYKARLEKQFGGLDARVGSLKATQSYLTQQIQMWTKN